ncbi:NADP-dependent oxidoreductase [Paractinoplanes rhizophilus]|uniref:NADP-dependent oxidoreductase n=1 Tax=Paractinoplanes rhizophilus TaxID=1416877 RepID=A0ABW2HM34_9ACTN
MKAIRFHEYGGPEVLREEEAERPSPAAGEVLIRVAGTTFNQVDAGLRGGYLREVFPLRLPHVPGIDVAGTIAESGPGVTGYAPGDPVVALLPMTATGATAEFVTAPADVVGPAPAGIPLADAAVLPAAALTAWQAIHEHGAVQPGQKVLVIGAGGAVGRFAVQFARLAGATVSGTATPRSAEAARSAGAELADRPEGAFDLVFVAARVDEATMAALAKLGPVLSITTPAVGGRNIYVRGDATQLGEIARLVDAGQVSVLVGDRRPFSETADVHRAAEKGELPGKVVLYPNS